MVAISAAIVPSTLVSDLPYNQMVCFCGPVVMDLWLLPIDQKVVGSNPSQSKGVFLRAKNH